MSGCSLPEFVNLPVISQNISTCASPIWAAPSWNHSPALITGSVLWPFLTCCCLTLPTSTDPGPVLLYLGSELLSASGPWPLPLALIYSLALDPGSTLDLPLWIVGSIWICLWLSLLWLYDVNCVLDLVTWILDLRRPPSCSREPSAILRLRRRLPSAILLMQQPQELATRAHSHHTRPLHWHKPHSPVTLVISPQFPPQNQNPGLFDLFSLLFFFFKRKCRTHPPKSFLVQALHTFYVFECIHQCFNVLF